MSRLWGSNGIAFGPDGRLYVAQFLAGQISAVDVATGDVEVVVPQGGPVQSPDDLAFGADGSMYITDLVPGWVWRRDPAGEYSLVSDQVAVPNGIATVGDRLFVNEMKPGGRVLELFPNGGDPRVLADGLMMGNAMQLGPDGCLYYPHMLTGQVFRVPLDGGAPELVAEDVHEPVAVRFDRGGVLMVLSRGVAGFVTRIDLAGGERTIVESGVLGLDNAAFDDENRMFVSSFASGGIAELHPDGRTRQIVAQGRVGPYGVAVSGGRVHVADHYTLVNGDKREMFVFVHGLAAEEGFLHTTSQYGDVRTYDLADGSVRMRAIGLNRPVGLAVRGDGALVVAEAGAGRVVAIDGDDAVTVLLAGLVSPVDVTFAGEQGYLSDEERGAVLRLDDGSPVAEGLSAPQGLAVRDGELLVVEAGRQRLLAVNPETGETRVEADNLAVGSVTRTEPELFTHGLPGVPRPLAGVAADPDGTLHISANAEGGVLSLPPGR